MRPFVIGQVVDSSPMGQRSFQKVGISRNLFNQYGCQTASLVVRTFRLRLPEGSSAGKEDGQRQWDVSAAGPHQLVAELPPVAKRALDEASLLLLFGHGAPGMTCSLDVSVFRNVKMIDKVVLCGSCFSAFPSESDFPPVVRGADGSAIRNDRERFVMRAIENGAVAVLGHMRENSGFPHLYPVLEAWMDGLSVGEAYQRLINAILDVRGLMPGELVLREGVAGSEAAAMRRNPLLYVIVGDPALRPLTRMSTTDATKKLSVREVSPGQIPAEKGLPLSVSR